jgi:hypothetical protein|tara:strand:- start:1047 stop:1247 length:201 start_codon:yes stop_codon:yes gene_type:complete
MKIAKVGDLVAERLPPFLIPADYGLVIGRSKDKSLVVMWDDGKKRKAYPRELLIISTTWSIINDFK